MVDDEYEFLEDDYYSCEICCAPMHTENGHRVCTECGTEYCPD